MIPLKRTKITEKRENNCCKYTIFKIWINKKTRTCSRIFYSHNMHQGQPGESLLDGSLEEVICPKMESVAWKNITVGVCWDLMCRISGMSFFARNFPTPWRDKFALWPHPCFYAPLYPPLKVWILSCGLTQTGQKWLEIPPLGNFPVSQVACCRYTLLAWNSSISLAGSEEHVHFPSNLPIEVTTHRESQIKVKVLK